MTVPLRRQGKKTSACLAERSCFISVHDALYHTHNLKLDALNPASSGDADQDVVMAMTAYMSNDSHKHQDVGRGINICIAAFGAWQHSRCTIQYSGHEKAADEAVIAHQLPNVDSK